MLLMVVVVVEVTGRMSHETYKLFGVKKRKGVLWLNDTRRQGGRVEGRGGQAPGQFKVMAGAGPGDSKRTQAHNNPAPWHNITAMTPRSERVFNQSSANTKQAIRRTPGTRRGKIKRLPITQQTQGQAKPHCDFMVVGVGVDVNVKVNVDVT
eukprot:5365398-Amphidinium_carterae.1